MPFLERVPYAKLKVEIAYDSGFSTAEGDRTWTAVTDDVDAVIGMQITYGRSDELTQPSPNTLSVTIDNDGGDYTPTSGGPLSIKKGLPIRVTVTYGGVDYPRYLGYIDSCSVLWPNGGEEMSQVAVTAASRRARLGQTAPLTSAIRAAYLASSPNAIWPLSDNTSNRAGQSVFLDITNSLATPKVTQQLAGFFTDTTYAPHINTGTPGLTDEGEPIFFPSTPTSYPADGRYVGGAGAAKINTNPAVGFGFEIVARLSPRPNGVDPVDLILFYVGSPGFRQVVYVFAHQDALGGGSSYVGLAMQLYDENHVLIESPAWFSLANGVYDTITDGEYHHFYVLGQEGAGQTFVYLYVDGVPVAYSTTSLGPIDRVLDTVLIGTMTRHIDLWTTWAAAHDRAFSTQAELDAHVVAATAASETDAERVIRIAGRVGIPAAEADVETSIAAPVGPQSEAGRSAVEVLDELATSVGGVLYDTRAGHLALQARNHRYNVASAFTLSAAAQQIEPDLTIVDDHRYTKNTVVFSRSGADDTVPATITDQSSIDDYGVFSQTYNVVSESGTEVEAFAENILARYADPAPRVSQITVVVTDLLEELRASVMAADIGTRFALASLPAQVPADPASVFFEGAAETINMTTHALTINTTPADLYQNVFTLDDPTLGRLDVGNVIAY